MDWALGTGGGPCYCGGHAIVGAMPLWGPCHCGDHAIVGAMHALVGGGGGGMLGNI